MSRELGAQLRDLCRDGDLIAAKALLEASADELLTAQQDPAADGARLVLDHASYLRGWATLQLRLGRIVGSGPAALTRPTPDLLLVSHPGTDVLRHWVGTAARITHLTVEQFRAELDGEADPSADLSDALGLPLDRYADQAIEAITAQAIQLGAPLIVVQGRPWLAVAASAAAHRLGLPLWWDLRGDAVALSQIHDGRPYSAPVPSPPADAAFRAAASTARLVVDGTQVAYLRSHPELRDRLLAISTGPHGTVPTQPSVWAAWRAVQDGQLASAPRRHYVGGLRAASSVPSVPRIAVLGSFDGFPHSDVVLNPAEIVPEEVDALVIDARTPGLWDEAKERAIQARTAHLPIVAIGLPEPAERPFADIVATIGPIPREARTSGHQPQWGFAAISDNPTGYRIALRAASLAVGAAAFAPRPAEPPRLEALGFSAPRPQLTVVIEEGERAAHQMTLDDLARQTLHPSLFTFVAEDAAAAAHGTAPRVVRVRSGERLEPDCLLNRWLSGPETVV